MATRSTKTATTPTKKTAAKATKTTAKTTKAAAKPAAKIPTKAAVVEASPIAAVVENVKPVVSAMPIKKPELIERVMAETGMKKKDVKPVVEAMLTVLGRTLAGGEELTVPPLGKVMIKRSKDVAKARILTLKLRHPKPESGVAKDTLSVVPD